MSNLKKKPFVPHRLEEERAKDKSKVYPVRLNKKQQSKLKQIQEDLDIPGDSTAIKAAFEIGFNVIHNQLGSDFFTCFKRGGG